MILLIDNYDSFSYNLFQMIGAIEPEIRVIRNDAYSVGQIREMNASGIIISPGPGRPEDAGVCIELIRSLAETSGEGPAMGDAASRGASGEGAVMGDAAARGASGEAPAMGDAASREAPGAGSIAQGRRIPPLLGVCLGHQSICAAFGARIGYAKELMHGKTSMCHIDTRSALFLGLEEEEQVGRYHSLAAVEDTMPDILKITARCADGEIMAVEHRQAPIYGIQFHPESILTPHGKKILENFVKLCGRKAAAAGESAPRSVGAY